MDVEAIKERIQEHADMVAGDGETATVTIGQAAGLPAWEIRVAWVRDGREMEEILQRGADLERMANETIGRIGTHLPQDVYYFRAERAAFREGPDAVGVCNPAHRHRTYEEAEKCDGTPGLDHIIQLVCATKP